MRTQLQERHRSRFTALTPEAVCRVWSRVVEAWPGDMRPFAGNSPDSPEELFEVCRNAGLDHARVVLSLAREHDPLGIGAIEALIGQPIAPWAASVEAQLPAPQTKPVTQSPPPDARVVVSVQENPHREGTGAWRSYQRWKVGATVGELVQRGMPTRAVRHNVYHGHVVLSSGGQVDEK